MSDPTPHDLVVHGDIVHPDGTILRDGWMAVSEGKIPPDFHAERMTYAFTQGMAAAMGAAAAAAQQPRPIDEASVEALLGMGFPRETAIEALRAANQIGDDTMQQRSQGRVAPHAFTHGTSAQRVRWFKRGMQAGEMNACDTFKAREV